jgi:glycosyltransferase involved in cell wall biosynthesis
VERLNAEGGVVGAGITGRIRVAHVMGEFMHGGTEKIVLDLLTRLDKSKFDIHVLCSSSEGLKEVRDKFAALGLGTSVAATGLGEASGRGWGLRTASRKMRSLLNMARVLRKGEFTIVHTHGLTNNLYARTAAIVAGAPVIVTHEHNVHGDTMRDRMLWALLNLKTALNLSVSETVGEFRMRSVPWSRRKSVILLNGIDLDVFHPPSSIQREAARGACGIEGDEKVIGVMGRLVPAKRVDVFLRAAALVLEICRCARFLIVGDGRERPGLEALASELGMSHAVRFTSWVARPEEALWAMDIFTIVSDQTEGFGLVTAEAMACGLPIVAADISLNREIVSDSCGIFVKPDPHLVAEGILRLLRHENLAFAMGTNAARRASERYDINRAAARLEDIYDQLTTRRPFPVH